MHLDRVPLKYEGLSYTEIWISNRRSAWCWPCRRGSAPTSSRSLPRSEDVEAPCSADFDERRRLKLFYRGNPVADLDMHFLHDGGPT